MLITKEWLQSIGACARGVRVFELRGDGDPVRLIEWAMMSKSKNALPDTNWLIARVFNRKQRIQYAVFASEQVLGIYERAHPRAAEAAWAAAAAVKAVARDAVRDAAKKEMQIKILRYGISLLQAGAEC